MSDEARRLVAELEALAESLRQELAPLGGEQEIRATQARYLGRKGRVSEAMKRLGGLPAEDRPAVGATANRVKEDIAAQVERRLAALAGAARSGQLARRVDVTLPGRRRAVGHLHLLTQVRREIEGIFRELGYEVAEGPQVESDWYNFGALNFPPDHPARDAQDTFFLGDGRLLRTHTSPVQVRVMTSRRPPVRIVCPGQVYRRDDDPTHSPMFSQVEGLVVDRGISFGDLKGTLGHFTARFFGARPLRFRASFFPFTEPSAEVDMQCLCGGGGCRLCKGSGWIEILGCGMVHPAVFEAVGYDPEAVTGFAFGMGIERMAMLRHGVGDIRLFYESDARFLRQF